MADIEDVIADLRKPRVIGRRPGLRPLTPATINRTVDRLRHMFNWAVGREYLDRTPFKRGSATLIKKLHEDNKRRRRIDDHEEAALLQKLERGHTFAGTKFQDIFKIAHLASGADTQPRVAQGERGRPKDGRCDWGEQGFDTARGGVAAAALLRPASSHD